MKLVKKNEYFQKNQKKHDFGDFHHKFSSKIRDFRKKSGIFAGNLDFLMKNALFFLIPWDVFERGYLSRQKELDKVLGT